MNSRKKGNTFEIAIMNLLKEYGYQATTSRNSSKVLDDSGVDLDTDFPFNIQCKSLERTPPYQQILKDMPKNKIPVIFHKRKHQGTVVVMGLDDFMNISELVSRSLSKGEYLRELKEEGLPKNFKDIGSGRS